MMKMAGVALAAVMAVCAPKAASASVLTYSGYQELSVVVGGVEGALYDSFKYDTKTKTGSYQSTQYIPTEDQDGNFAGFDITPYSYSALDFMVKISRLSAGYSFEIYDKVASVVFSVTDADLKKANGSAIAFSQSTIGTVTGNFVALVPLPPSSVLFGVALFVLGSASYARRRVAA